MADGPLLVLELALPGAVPRPGDFEKQCSFCLRELQAIVSLVSGPGVSVCDRCVAHCVKELRRSRASGFRPFWDLRPPRALSGAPSAGPYRGARDDCSFCRRREPGVVLVRAEHAQICATCVRLAADVVDEGARGQTKA